MRIKSPLLYRLSYGSSKATVMESNHRLQLAVGVLTEIGYATEGAFGGMIPVPIKHTWVS